MLSYAHKWFDQQEVHITGLPDFKRYEEDKTNDLELVRSLWDVVNFADIIVAHNGDAFDIKKTNARFIHHDLPPPSTYKTIDTLKIARKHFKFESNSLNDLASYLELGSKLPHAGFRMWKGCMAGDTEAWEMMKQYNVHDVTLLEQVYLKLRPWASEHPNLNMYTHEDNCPTCQSPKVQRRGFSYAKTQVRQRFQCTSCGSWYTGRLVKKEEL